LKNASLIGILAYFSNLGRSGEGLLLGPINSALLSPVSIIGEEP